MYKMELFCFLVVVQKAAIYVVYVQNSGRIIILRLDNNHCCIRSVSGSTTIFETFHRETTISRGHGRITIMYYS